LLQGNHNKYDHEGWGELKSLFYLISKRDVIVTLILISSFLLLFTIFPLRSYGANNNSPDKLKILSLLKDERFKELDNLLSSYQASYEADTSNDASVIKGYYSFENSDTKLEFKLNKWIKRMPKSYSAYLSRAIYYKNLGWLSRGYAFAQDTSESQFENMRNYFALAINDLKTALSLNPKLIMAYESLISISMTVDTPPGTNEAILRKVEQFDPASFLIRRRYIFSLQPKWGGSIDEMKAFINESKQYCDMNPRLKIISGYVPYALGDMIRKKDRLKALEYYNQALSYGDHWWFFYKRGLNFYFMDKNNEAIKDFSRALLINPQHSEVLSSRGWAYYHLDRYQEALQDFNLAINLDALEPHTLRGRGSTYYAQQKYNNALMDYTNALKYDGHNHKIWWLRGRLNLYKLKNYAQAVNDLKKAIDIDPYNKKYWYNYSRALYYNNDCSATSSLKTYLNFCNKQECKTGKIKWAKKALKNFENKVCL
jgi:tetratricopeptide (TPR) repeat protein